MVAGNAEFDSKVRLEVYRLFLRDGLAPAIRDVAAALESSATEIRAAFERLADEHKLVLQPESRELLMASPLSGVPTPFLVEVEGHSTPLFGNCIWDAMGIPPMLHRDGKIPAGRIVTGCGCCGERLVVRIAEGHVDAPVSSVCHFALPAKRWWDDIVFN